MREQMRVRVGVALMSLLGLIPAQAGDAWQKVSQQGALVVGLEGTFPPYSFRAAPNAELQGFEVDFGRMLAQQLGVKAQFKTIIWGQMLSSLKAGRVDVVVNQVVATTERSRNFDFSIPYTYTGLQMVVRKADQSRFRSAADLAGAHVGVGAGTNYEQWLRANVPQAHVHLYHDDLTKYDGLRRGEVNAIVINRLAAFNLMLSSHGELLAAGRMLAREDACVTMRKGNPRLLAEVNRAIGHLQRDGSLLALSRKWFKADIVSRPE
ncbi:transporter substrate-binding domain-containing protein [Chromobacterium sp. IIBBL 290-4]|uniref:transporter substrate-binding domain-containing protein n=1 Tax=Chromobacterium sp. IIBBL 290-4 TaxID=2953890 RepID=UPI0020B8107B|nr:transporter substrate-binding domain-containing protein [Chromobacterium sp. IIBBL 290-4]UTH73606.1 transporter substrate-binding domain-containing protein [Chromobacterium sp. IIBBL 290-4]